jgi:hypothetical protein
MTIIGDRVKLVETEVQGVVIGKNLGNVRYKCGVTTASLPASL